MTPGIEELERHRVALRGHCYRMLGSATDAEDAVQEALIRGWKALAGFDGRSSLRTWLYRIATNVCLDELERRGRREHPIETGEPGSPAPPVEQLMAMKRPAGAWIEPMADARAVPADANPAERAMLKQSIRLAFVAALQKLAPRQRAALLLMEVLGFTAAETAEALGMPVAAVNSALQRARAVLARGDGGVPAELTADQQALLERYVAAFERYDIDALTALMRHDATFCMPPYTLWLRGPEAVRTWMLGLGSGCRGSRLVPVDACGGPAFAQYRAGDRAWSLIVLELDGGEIVGVTSFLDVETVFPQFGLPLIFSSTER